MAAPPPETILEALLAVNETAILPLTQAGVKSGSKVFGAAILRQDTLEPITVASNNERESPLLHGEINCIQKFFAEHADPATRPDIKACLLFATHEPCSLCLSGIAWAGLPQFYYMFTYEDSRDTFAIPYDIDILQAVYRVRSPGDSDETLDARPLYNRQNKFFTGTSFAELLAQVSDSHTRSRLGQRIAALKEQYNRLNADYQDYVKKGDGQTASVWR